jgi:hypothetical protein
MEPIKDTVIKVMQGLQAGKTRICDDDFCHLLKKALTKKELAHIKFNYFRKGILSLCVDSSSWLYNLALKKDNLLLELNKKSNAVKDIRFRIGEMDEEKKSKTS